MKVFIVFIFLFEFIHADINKKYPCEPKFGETGNYIQFQLKNIQQISSKKLKICFGEEKELCFHLEDLPSRIAINKKKWTPWGKTSILKKNRLYQFSFCNNELYKKFWEKNRDKLSFSVLDNISLVNNTNKNLFLSQIKVVQNRVKVLELQNKKSIKFFENISFSKLIYDYKISKYFIISNEKVLNSILEDALGLMGHSGSVQFGLEDTAYCSEFIIYLIKNSTLLDKKCKATFPNPYENNIGSYSLLKYFNKCNLVMKKNTIKSLLAPGDYLSVGNRAHSVIFLGWGDKQKKTFWEISGNNQCIPEKETLYNPNFKSNMICITKRVYKTSILEKDYAVPLHKFAIQKN